MGLSRKVEGGVLRSLPAAADVCRLGIGLMLMETITKRTRRHKDLDKPRKQSTESRALLRERFQMPPYYWLVFSFGGKTSNSGRLIGSTKDKDGGHMSVLFDFSLEIVKESGDA